MADKTKTIEATAPALPAVTLSQATLKSVYAEADAYFADLNNIRRLSGEMELAKFGKFARVVRTGAIACKLATKGAAFDTSLALAYYDAADAAFCARMVQDDTKNRTEEGKPAPEARRMVDIDRSYPVLRSVVRKAIERGHNVTGTEKKADLQEAAGNATSRKPGGQTTVGDEPITDGKNVTKSVISKATPKLAAVLNEIASLVNDGLSPDGQNELASMLVDTLGAFREAVIARASAKTDKMRAVKAA